MDAIASVFARSVVHMLVRSARDLANAAIGLVLVDVHLGSGRDVGLNVALEHALKRLRNLHRANASATLDQHGYGRLAILARGMAIGALAGLAADVGFICLHDLARAAELVA